MNEMQEILQGLQDTKVIGGKSMDYEAIPNSEYQECYVKIDVKEYKLTGEIVPTSEVLTVDEVIGRTGEAPKGGFEIVRIPFICKMLSEVCGPKGKVLAYILENKDDGNRLDITTANLSEKTGVSMSTVRKVIDKMENLGLMCQLTGQIFVNPSLFHKGNYRKEARLFKKFDDVMKLYKKGVYAGSENPKEPIDNPAYLTN